MAEQKMKSLHVCVCLRGIQRMHAEIQYVCGVFRGCSWTGCIIDVLLALPGSCSLIARGLRD